jgi:hypothetical protein
VIHITETGETHSSFKIRWVQLKIINQNHQPILPVAGNHL